MEIHRIEPGETLFFQGMPGKHMYRLQSGIIACYFALKSPVFIGFSMPGDLIGIEAAVGGNYTFTAECVKKASLEQYSSPQAKALLIGDEYRRLAEGISRQMEQWIKQPGIQSPEEISLLLEELEEIDEVLCRKFFNPMLFRQALDLLVSKGTHTKVDHKIFRKKKREVE